MLLKSVIESIYLTLSFPNLASAALPLIYAKSIIVAREEGKAAELSVCLNQNKKKEIKANHQRHEHAYQQQ